MTRIERIIISVISVRSVFVLSSRAPHRCHLELVERSFFIYPFLAHSEKRTKRGVLPPRPPSKGDANGSRGRPTTPVPFWYRGTRDILSYIPAVAVPWKGTHRSAMFCMVYPFNPNNPCSPLLRGPARNGDLTNQTRPGGSKNVKIGLISDGNRPFLVRKTLKRL